MSLLKSTIKIRVELQTANLRKSGKNSHAGFSYYELRDFLPTLNVLMANEDMNDIFAITETMASLTLVQGEERETYTVPFTHFATPLTNAGKNSMQDIQYLGAMITYYKRYLYLNAFGITDGEIIDGMPMPDYKTYQTWSKAGDQDKIVYKKEFMDGCSDRGADDVLDVFNFLGIDHTDKHVTHNAVVKFLRDSELFDEQIESYKLYKIKQEMSDA